ncbi:hypothetical protein [Burkholderia multivorans]|uniref:hypothetical protein n=1 Tax=Burkholderia multivorans TaxID=87883 RepID=UPI000CFEFFF9|nr:hypothetical protein [Burkholderia multivorans]MCL4626040.1 hypothetical protein [Burkholderia multivorans]MCO1388178.1 hypothetical protein [Burkholderia multivorans]NGM80155.1 hypothetical protein [Burkholderia multivorans]UQO11898.1 hypothetical protein L0Z40_02190 [Burkholderia multivorans]UQO56223.1 hypothetical protein L0Z30_23160 [Burkholderia multivorans]
MSIFSSWNKSLVGKPWIRLDDAGTILAGGSPRSGAPRSAHFQADYAHWLSLVTDAVARGTIATTEHDGTRYVRQADLRRWCEVGGTPWKVPHHPSEDDAPADAAESPSHVTAADHGTSNSDPEGLDPREQTTLLVLVAAAARAGKLEASAIERAASELGVTLSRRTITKHLNRIADAIERRQEIAR